ncbi:MAG: M56 family metallopeptidase [Butyrivibrio sp.]|nr:M56 family metallopeptidase [Muribaculum sp.]MCM1551627.1 M56 family metallopeptidase [Butyrivibrio sp.]
MNMIANIFLTILGMSLTAAYCILAVCLLRVLLRRMPKIFSYFLWSVVALRLVCPILPESRFSLMGERVVESARRIAATDMEYGLESGTEAMADRFDGVKGDLSNNILPEAEGIGTNETQNGIANGIGSENGINGYPSGMVWGDFQADGQESSGTLGNVIYPAAAVWLSVFLILCIYSTVSYRRLKRRLAGVAYTGRPFEGIPVKYANGLETPFVLGLLHPTVYLPDTLTDSEAIQCLSHERVHVRRRDYLVKQFAFVLACVHWFNPFVWLAFHLMSQDMEMSCDEQALQSPALADRKAYSDALLKMSTGRLRFSGCPLAFGESSVSLRIKNIMNYKKPSFWAVVAVCVVMVICMAGLFTNPTGQVADETEQNNIGSANVMANKADSPTNASEAENPDSTATDGTSLPKQPEWSIGSVQAQYETDYLKDITDTEGRSVELNDSATKYLNRPDINCFLMQNFNTSRIDLAFLLYDNAGMENSEPDTEELRLLESTVEEGIWSGGIFYHITGEQLDQFLMERLGLPLSEIQCGTESGNTLKDNWEYLEEYDSYTMFGPKGDTMYTEVDYVDAFEYYNGILRLDYRDKLRGHPYSPNLSGSLYLAPNDNLNGDVNNLDSYYIIGNVIHEGVLKEQNAENTFDLTEYLNRLKQVKR